MAPRVLGPAHLLLKLELLRGPVEITAQLIVSTAKDNNCSRLLFEHHIS